MKTTLLFTSQDIKNAEKHNTKMYKRRGVVKNTRSGNAHIKGYLGELLFEAYLKAAGIEYERAPEHTGDKGDEYDFLIGNNKIDVKCTHMDDIIADEYQAAKAAKNAVTIVFVHISKDLREGTLIGYAKAEWEDLPHPHYFNKKWPKTKWKWIPSSKFRLFKEAYVLWFLFCTTSKHLFTQVFRGIIILLPQIPVDDSKDHGALVSVMETQKVREARLRLGFSVYTQKGFPLQGPLLSNKKNKNIVLLL